MMPSRKAATSLAVISCVPASTGCSIGAGGFDFGASGFVWGFWLQQVPVRIRNRAAADEIRIVTAQIAESNNLDFTIVPPRLNRV